ncbi:Uncharacterized protein FWK35_00034226, partial [Aphis craccivora]
AIKCTPHEARINACKIQPDVQLKNKTIYKLKFKINDKVRISKYKHIFSKRYTPNWITEIFTVSKIFQTNPITYQLKDESDNINLGSFCEQEIKLTNFPNIFLIERVVKKVKNKMLVKWLGFNLVKTRGYHQQIYQNSYMCQILILKINFILFHFLFVMSMDNRIPFGINSTESGKKDAELVSSYFWIEDKNNCSDFVNLLSRCRAPLPRLVTPSKRCSSPRSPKRTLVTVAMFLMARWLGGHAISIVLPLLSSLALRS